MSDQVSRPLVTATVAGTLLQLAMVVSGHYAPAVANLFAAGGMSISAIAGLGYAVLAKPTGIGVAAGGGAVAGGISALAGILVSYLWGDVDAAVLGLGTAGSAVTGLLGGVLGKVIAGRRTAHPVGNAYTTVGLMLQRRLTGAGPAAETSARPLRYRSDAGARSSAPCP
jgi:hypothetical protein